MKNEHLKKREEFKTLFFMVQYEPTRFQDVIEKSELNISYKKILWGFFYYRKKNKAKIYENLKTFPLSDEFGEGVRLYLLGLSQNLFGKHQFAQEYLEAAVIKFKSANDEHFSIYAISTIILNLANRKLIKEMAYWLDELKEHSPPNDYCRLLVYQAEASYLSKFGEIKKSENVIDHAYKISGKELKLFMPSFLMLKFQNAFTLRQYEECYSILDVYKKSPGFIASANYSYMKIMLDHLVNDHPLYIYPNEFQDSQELLDQLLVIKHLSQNDKTEAKIIWARLSKHNPQVYKENYHFNAPYSLFSCALEKYKHDLKSNQIDVQRLKKIPNRLERLHYILKNGGTIIKKSDLILWIWSEEVSETSLNRLRKLVNDYKKKYKCELKSSQDCYKVKRVA